MSWQLQNFDTKNFIHQYWQKKPCLIKQAIPNFESPITPEELAGLACEDEVHSRLVIERDGETPWQLKYGPFDEAAFHALPATHYSLLVSECEKWIPEFADILDQFRFIPSWRVDDLMMSYAPTDGSVGPHCDEYDVFLLQAYGRRQWQYTDKPVENPSLIPDLDLAILAEFSFDQEIILAPGDILYLPPGIAHHGVALDRCMTISVGFRAPTANEVLESFLLEIDQRNLGIRRYADPCLESDRHYSEITDAEIGRFKSLALSVIDQPDSLWRDTIGKLLSDSTVAQQHRNDLPVTFDEIANHHWVVNPDSKMLYHRNDTNVMFYCNGHVFELLNSPSAVNCVRDLCEGRSLTPNLLNACRDTVSLESLLCQLVAISAIIPEENDE